MNLNLDWLHLIVDRARFLCVKREYPRVWSIQIPVMLVDTRGQRRVEGFGYDVHEYEIPPEVSEGLDPEVRRERQLAENVTRLFQARQKLHADVIVASRERRLHRRAFKALLPVSARSVDNKVRRLGEKAFQRDCTVIHVEGARWALKHKPTGVSVFFDYEGQDPAEFKSTALSKLEELEEALGKVALEQSNPEGGTQ